MMIWDWDDDTPDWPGVPGGIGERESRGLKNRCSHPRVDVEIKRHVFIAHDE
jgi:hypothetical protein